MSLGSWKAASATGALQQGAPVSLSLLMNKVFDTSSLGCNFLDESFNFDNWECQWQRSLKLTFCVTRALNGNLNHQNRSKWGLWRAELAKTWEQEAKTYQEPGTHTHTQITVQGEACYRSQVYTRQTNKGSNFLSNGSSISPYSSATLPCSETCQCTHTGDSTQSNLESWLRCLNPK